MEVKGHNDLDKVDLVDHVSLRVLFPYMHSYCLKALEEVRSRSYERATISGIEKYSMLVLEKVGEIDSSLTSLRLAYQFLLELAENKKFQVELYRYHYENFVFRVMGVVDRAHRAVGASILMSARQYECARGNSNVIKKIVHKYPELHCALVKVSDVARDYRAPRNQVIHSEAFSSREIGIFDAVRRFDVDAGSVDIEELQRDYYLECANEVDAVIMSLTLALVELLDALAPVYVDIKAASENLH